MAKKKRARKAKPAANGKTTTPKKRPPECVCSWGTRNGKQTMLITVKNITDGARYFSITRHTLYDWIEKGCPQNEDGSIVLNDAMIWAMKHVYGPKFKETKHNDVHADLRVRKLQQDVRFQELAWAREIKAVIPAHFVDELFELVALKYQTAGDLLMKHHGKQAQKIVLDTNKSIEREIEKRFSDIEE